MYDKWLRHNKAVRGAKMLKGLGNPFKGKSAKQIDQMFRKKGFEVRGGYPEKRVGWLC